MTIAALGSQSRMRRLIRHEGGQFMVIIRLLGLVPIRLMHHLIGSIARY